jgi:purine nucleoside permease
MRSHQDLEVDDSAQAYRKNYSHTAILMPHLIVACSALYDSAVARCSARYYLSHKLEHIRLQLMHACTQKVCIVT